MASRKQKTDFYSGIPWVHVTPEQARALPQGKLNLFLYAICIYFLCVAALKFGFILSVGAGLGVALLNSIWPFLTGLGLLFRVPWAIIMAVVSASLTVWFLVRGPQIAGTDGASLVPMCETIFNVGILFYLVEADRPNLIYRHRYRKYSVEQTEDTDRA